MCAAFVRFKKVKLISTGVYKRIYCIKTRTQLGKMVKLDF